MVIDQKIEIWDTTLRDGEQTPGVVFSEKEKEELAHRFDDFGVDGIAIMPSVSVSDENLVRRLSKTLNADITSLVLMKKEHIDQAIECGAKNIKLLTSASDYHLETKLKINREANIERSLKWAEYCKLQGVKKITLAVEDSSRADLDYVLRLANILSGKIDYFIPCDTMGKWTPFETYDTIKAIKENSNLEIVMHVHNDLGQATANTLAGLMAGATVVSGTFTGIGERAGNAAIEEVVMALRHQYNRELGVKYDQIYEICKLVQQYSGVRLQPHKAVCGNNAYRHEAGIHVDGIIKNPVNYELFDPNEIGARREFLYGKKSGRSGLRYLFGDRFGENELSNMLTQIVSRSESEKRAFSEEEIKKMFCDNGFSNIIERNKPL